tara:strand:+ start:7871 stop:8530 length:660 start_codon:yes stop_codon:yes gene_type:complete
MTTQKNTLHLLKFMLCMICFCVCVQSFSKTHSSIKQKRAEALYNQAVTAMRSQKNAQAIKLLTQAGELGHIDAQNDLGLLYQSGMMVPQDYKRAMQWYKKAASKNYIPAMFNIGLMYHKGLGVSQDYKRARIWFLRAAKLNDADAQYNLGVMHHQGLGVKMNHKEAYIWFSLSAINGSKKGLDARDRVAVDLDLKTIAEADKTTKAQYDEFLLNQKKLK